MQKNIVGGLLVLGVFLVIGHFKRETALERVMNMCMSNIENQSKCECYAGEYRAKTSIIDEAPLLRMFTDSSDGRAEAIVQAATEFCNI